MRRGNWLLTNRRVGGRARGGGDTGGAARQLRGERELACDDLVLAAGSRASDYATHLLEIARGLRVGALAGVASIAMARPSQLAGRPLAVLDAPPARKVATR